MTRDEIIQKLTEWIKKIGNHDVQVYHAQGSKILGKEAGLIIDEANAYKWEKKKNYDITDGWIPCCERLPSERGWYLITVQDVNRFTDIDYYYGNSEWDEVSSKQEVIAWMPLPKPYKAESEKKHEG